MFGVGPLSRLDRDRYTQVQSMEENEIGLLWKSCNVHVGLLVKFCCGVYFPCMNLVFPYVLYCCIGNHTSFAEPFFFLSFNPGNLFHDVDG